MIAQSASPILDQAYRFSIAPMLDCTDRHFRVLMRLISKRALLYTEMVVARAVHHSTQRSSLLDFDAVEHPISLQIGGDDPKLLAETAQIAEDWGYDEINLNIGCPSPKVQSGNFGACLMAQPNLVAECIEAMKKVSKLPITVKHRIGIDDLSSEFFLHNFVDTVAEAGVLRFIVHARIAILKGLNPKENRSIPPLEYEKVARLKEHRPDLKIEVNGGLQTPYDCLKVLQTFDGAMVGRAVYNHPLAWNQIDEIIFGEKSKKINASTILKELIPYAQNHLSKNGRLWDICKHTVHLVEGKAGAKAWRREISLKAQSSKADISVLEKSAQQLIDVGL